MAAVLGVMGVAAAAFAAPAAPLRVPRAELESLQASVEAAVTKVSRPAGLMFGRRSRAYHLKGYGAMVVLAPRVLPREHRRADPHTRALADVVRRLERTIEEVRDPEERRRLEEALIALRHERPPSMPMPRPRIALTPRDFESMQEEAEAFRREAERAMEKAEREVILRLHVEPGSPFVFTMDPPDPPDPPEAPEAPGAPHAPEPPAPPDATAPAMPPMPPSPHAPAVAPAPPVPALPPMPHGWSFWSGETEPEGVPADRVLLEVRRAIVTGLGAHRGGLSLLAPDDFVVVAVDFVPRMSDRAGTRTVVARARKRDLADHRAGRISAEALQGRVEFDEY